MKQMLKLTVLIIALFSFRAYSQNYPEMIAVEGGTFIMGDAFGVGNKDEKPTHSVILKSFKIAKTEATVAQYRTYCDAIGVKMPEPPKWGWQDDAPIVNVSWDDAVAYCKWLSNELKRDYSLPSEAEWEFSARGGNKSLGYSYSGCNDLEEVAWYTSNSGGQANLVMKKKPNELGLYDMSGNVWEFCLDWYNEKYYTDATVSNPKGPETGNSRVLRGGCWSQGDALCRVAARNSHSTDCRHLNIGFRVISHE
ncbi:MAG: formylglycine-generating enzyme family protein [Bacteroidetes bacterium]|nr:formylglycine-generating enzyme family protein [Bacteroidota bacterium]